MRLSSGIKLLLILFLSINYAQSVCGDGVIDVGEQCDTGTANPGCSSTCKVNFDYSCTVASPSVCTQISCGDSIVQNPAYCDGIVRGGSRCRTTRIEECDNGRAAGCLSCTVQVNFQCTSVPGAASICGSTCGDDDLQTTAYCDGTLRGNQICRLLIDEECENRGAAGCTACKVEPNYSCTYAPPAMSVCTPTCGDNVRQTKAICDGTARGGKICRLTRDEECDNGAVAGGGCTACVVEMGYSCIIASSPSVCSLISCGDNSLQTTTFCNGTIRGSTICRYSINEECDNGGAAGCAACVIEADYSCTNILGSPSVCNPISCGDSLLQNSVYCNGADRGGFACRTARNEECDNGGAVGCAACLVSGDYSCTYSLGVASACSLLICGDGIVNTAINCDGTVKNGQICRYLTPPEEPCDDTAPGNNGGCIGCAVQANFRCSSTGVCSQVFTGTITPVFYPIRTYQPSTTSNTTNSSNAINSSSTTSSNAICGNRIVQGTEQCDTGRSAGCSSCVKEAGYTCNTAGTQCTLVSQCGNNVKQGFEQCDNGNQTGCLNCSIDLGYECIAGTNLNSICTLKTGCGNGIREAGEECDNGNKTGCISCIIGFLYYCEEDANQQSTCIRPKCGNGKIQGNEECDNYNLAGCRNCIIQVGYSCSTNSAGLSTCTLSGGSCGNQIRQSGQQCDNGGFTGCVNCAIQYGYACFEDVYTFSHCAPVSSCGNGRRQTSNNQQCDDGNTFSNDGCNSNCFIELGWSCQSALTDTISQCQRSQSLNVVCGDGIKESSEGCDDGNIRSGDGCSSVCLTEQGWNCIVRTGSQTSICTKIQASDACGNGVKESQFSEQCDDSNKKSGDGCSASCQMEPGFVCPSFKATCLSICGNGWYEGYFQEQCDDGNINSNDGCSDNCVRESGFFCTSDYGKTSICYRSP